MLLLHYNLIDILNNDYKNKNSYSQLIIMIRQNSKTSSIISDGLKYSSTAAIPSSRCHLIKAYSKCFTFLAKPKNTGETDDKGPTLELDDFESHCELDVPSEILSTSQVDLLEEQLPPIAHGGTWTLAFSTTQNGFTLHALYRKMNSLKNDLPVLVVIEDTQDHVFGVLASCPLKISESFYGLGCSFLFRFSPSLQVFNWAGENFYFIKGDPDFISFGSGNGRYGLWLDGDLNKGRTESCDTFKNPPLIPDGGGDFTIKTLEVWTFGW